jgi:hypothetical protein
LDVWATVGTDGIEGVIVGKDDQDIGTLSGFFQNGGRQQRGIAQEEQQGKPGKVGSKSAFFEHDQLLKWRNE